MKISSGFKRIAPPTPLTSYSPVSMSPKASGKILSLTTGPELSLEMFKNVTNIQQKSVKPVSATKSKSVKPGRVGKGKSIRKRRKYNTKKHKPADVRFIYIYKKKIERLERSEELFDSLIKLVN